MQANILAHTESVEKEILKLRHEIEDLEQSSKIDPEISRLETQNNKLKQQISHLQQAIENEKCKQMIAFPTNSSQKKESVASNLNPDVSSKVRMDLTQYSESLYRLFSYL